MWERQQSVAWILSSTTKSAMARPAALTTGFRHFRIEIIAPPASHGVTVRHACVGNMHAMAAGAGTLECDRSNVALTDFAQLTGPFHLVGRRSAQE